MDFNTYQSRLLKAIGQRNSYLMLAAGLLVLSIVLSVVIVLTINKEKIIVTPPVINHSFWVTDKEVSPEYLTEMSLFFTGLRLNMTPSNTAFLHDTLLTYTDPRYYGALSATLLAEAERISRDRITVAFYPTTVSLDMSHLSVDVSGDEIETIGSSQMPSKKMHYRLHYRYLNSRLWITSFEEVTHE